MRPGLAAALMLGAICAPMTSMERAFAASPAPRVPSYPGPWRNEPRLPTPPTPPTAAEVAAEAKRQRRNAARLATAGART